MQRVPLRVPSLSSWGSSLLRVPSVHTVPQLPVSLQWVIHLRLAKRGTVAPGVHAYRAVAGDLPLGPAVGCLDNMLLLLGPTCSVFGFNF